MRFLRTRWLLLAATATSLTIACPARAEDTRHKINATGEGIFTGPTSTASQIIGGGILHGTTTSELVITGFDPATGTLSYAGTFVITTKHGTLTLSVYDGLYNPTTGEFLNNCAATSGTDWFACATGTLYLHGFVFPDGTFIDDAIVGEICVDLP